MAVFHWHFQCFQIAEVRGHFQWARRAAPVRVHSPELGAGEFTAYDGCEKPGMFSSSRSSSSTKRCERDHPPVDNKTLTRLDELRGRRRWCLWSLRPCSLLFKLRLEAPSRVPYHPLSSQTPQDRAYQGLSVHGGGVQERLKPETAREEKNEEDRSRVDDLRGFPMAVGTMEGIIDDDHAIVSTMSGPEFYVSIMSYVDKDLLEPGCSVLLHHKTHSIVGILQDDADPTVKLEKAPTESYADIGGLEQQIQEIKVILPYCVLP